MCVEKKCSETRLGIFKNSHTKKKASADRGLDSKTYFNKFLRRADQRGKAAFLFLLSSRSAEFFRARRMITFGVAAEAKQVGGGTSVPLFAISCCEEARQKGLRPDTISDIISALCIPLNNDSISTRPGHLFIPPFLRTMNSRKKPLFFFFPSQPNVFFFLVNFAEETAENKRDGVF